jgi:hypothetical protein
MSTVLIKGSSLGHGLRTTPIHSNTYLGPSWKRRRRREEEHAEDKEYDDEKANVEDYIKRIHDLHSPTVIAVIESRNEISYACSSRI